MVEVRNVDHGEEAPIPFVEANCRKDLAHAMKIVPSPAGVIVSNRVDALTKGFTKVNAAHLPQFGL